MVWFSDYEEWSDCEGRVMRNILKRFAEFLIVLGIFAFAMIALIMFAPSY